MENYLVEARRDPATVFPSEVLAKLRSDSVIGELADSYYSCMGGIYSQSRVTTELIPSLTEAIDKERIDLLLLVKDCHIPRHTGTTEQFRELVSSDDRIQGVRNNELWEPKRSAHDKFVLCSESYAENVRRKPAP